MSKTYLVAVQTIHLAAKKGEPVRTIYAGTPVASDDPAVKANPSAFRTPEEIAEARVPEHRPVEQATAAPGEKRTVSRKS